MSLVVAFGPSTLLSFSSSLPSVSPQVDDTPGGLHINMWYLLSGLENLITASKCKLKSSLPVILQALAPNMLQGKVEFYLHNLGSDIIGIRAAHDPRDH